MNKMEIDRSPKRYLQDGDVDVVARQNVQLMTELWVVKDRLAVLEKILADAGLIPSDAAQTYVPEGDFAQTLEHERAAYVERVLSPPGREWTVDALKQLSGTVRARS